MSIIDPVVMTVTSIIDYTVIQCLATEPWEPATYTQSNRGSLERFVILMFDYSIHKVI